MRLMILLLTICSISSKFKLIVSEEIIYCLVPTTWYINPMDEAKKFFIGSETSVTNKYYKGKYYKYSIQYKEPFYTAIKKKVYTIHKGYIHDFIDAQMQIPDTTYAAIETTISNLKITEKSEYENVNIDNMLKHTKQIEDIPNNLLAFIKSTKLYTNQIDRLRKKQDEECINKKNIIIKFLYQHFCNKNRKYLFIGLTVLSISLFLNKFENKKHIALYATPHNMEFH